MVCPSLSPRSPRTPRTRSLSPLPLSCLLELTILFRFSSLVCGADVYVDDTDGALSYSGSWQEGSGCSTCALHPDTSQMYGGTWHDTTYYSNGDAMSITLKFTGVGISAYFVVPDKSQGDTTVGTDLVFTLDGFQAGTYTHSPSGDVDFLYNQTLFEKSGLSNEDHTLVVSAAASDGQSSAVLFDYLVYETEDETSSSGVTTSTSTSSTSLSSSSSSTSSSTATSGSSSPSGSSSSSGTSSGSPSSTTAESSSDFSSTGSSNVSPTNVSASGNTTSVSDSSDSSSSHTNVGAIAGGVVGGVLFALLLLFCCLRRTKRAREGTDDNVLVPTSDSATMRGAAGRTRSWFWLKPREGSTLPYPVTFSDAGTSPHTCKAPPYSSTALTTYNEKGRPVVHPDHTSSPTSVINIGPDRQRWPYESTEESQNLGPTMNTADILSQVAAIHAAVLSLQDQRANALAVDADTLLPPPTYSAGVVARSGIQSRPNEGHRARPR